MPPFADAIDIIQENKSVTIGYVVPTILDLDDHLEKCLNVFGIAMLYSIPCELRCSVVFKAVFEIVAL